ncbi:MAG: GntR family transcriptional regulator [Agathobacter sp.]|nr:GntR family transcriptional regulator [Agathobacter sp.]
MSYKHTATSDGVYEQLKEQILHLELPPGAAISEIETAEKYNISRTPVRDAFKRLEREGLLEIRPHIGTFVSLIDLHAVSDVLYIREVLEFSVLSDLAQIYDNSHDLHIRLILQKQKDLLESDMPIEELSRAFIISDNEFHTALFDAAGKKNIIKFLYAYNSQYERFRTFINFNGKEDLKKLYDCHVKIIECISNKDFVTLKDCIRHHLYDGFSASSDIISKSPEYFSKLH